jgi:nickel/cobalt exporter
VILGIFVTLSHTGGIVLVGVLASLGSGVLRPQRIESYLALGVGILVIVLGLWMLWTQRDLLALAMGEARTSADKQVHSHELDDIHHSEVRHQHRHHHDHPSEKSVVRHTHGWGTAHAHRVGLVTENRPKLPVLGAISALLTNAPSVRAGQALGPHCARCGSRAECARVIF